MGSLGLLELSNVVPLLADFPTELDRVFAFVPCCMILDDTAGQGLVLAVVGVPAKISRAAVSVKCRPPGNPERVRQTELVGPVREVGQGSRALVGAVHANQQLVQQRGGQRT